MTKTKTPRYGQTFQIYLSKADYEKITKKKGKLTSSYIISLIKKDLKLSTD